MPKRLFAILFSSLAGLIILAHGIIPHHHHGDRICFEVFHKSHVCHLADHNDCSGHHEHEPAQSNDECCLLNQMVLVHPDGTRLDIEAAGQPAENQIPDALRISLFTVNLSLMFPGKNLPFRQHPPNPTYLSEYVCHTLGMRAPPAV